MTFLGTPSQPHVAMMIPFAALLLCIACCPLLTPKFWEHHYHNVSIVLGAISLAIYFFVLRNPGRIGHVAVEYISFIPSSEHSSSWREGFICGRKVRHLRS
jgi:hypothetical protein